MEFNMEKRYVIDLPEAIVQVYPESVKKYEKGLGYIHNDLVYIYRGKEGSKKNKELIPGSVYKTKDEDHYLWVDPPEDDKEVYSAERIIAFDDKSTYEAIQNKSNLKQADSRLIESADDAYIVPFETTDDVLKRAVKKVLMDMRIDVRPPRDTVTKYGVTNMKSNLTNRHAKMSITYFLKWCNLLNLDAHLLIKFKNSDGEEQIINQDLLEDLTCESENP